MIVDFHSHTYFSDGSLAPEALLSLMTRRGVEIFAITDHDTLGAHGYLDARPAEYGPRRVTGVELNTTYAANEIHVLGYGFQAAGSNLDALLARNRLARVDRIGRMAQQLTAAGFAVTMDDVSAAAAGAEALGRPHVAKALVARGHSGDVKSAMKQFLVRGKPGYVPSDAISPFEAVTAIHEAGGIAVLAHPCRLDDYGLIEIMARAGIDGLEVYYPRNTTAQTAHFREKALEFGLLMTAGSDFHDIQYSPRGVGMDVEPADLAPFLERLSLN